MGNANRIHHAVFIAASFLLTTGASAKAPSEPIAVQFVAPASETADRIAAACMKRGWAVSERTDFSVSCTDKDAIPNPATVKFELARDGEATMVQLTTRQVLLAGFRPLFGPSRKLATDALTMLSELGAMPK